MLAEGRPNIGLYIAGTITGFTMASAVLKIVNNIWSDSPEPYILDMWLDLVAEALITTPLHVGRTAVNAVSKRLMYKSL